MSRYASPDTGNTTLARILAGSALSTVRRVDAPGLSTHRRAGAVRPTAHNCLWLRAVSPRAQQIGRRQRPMSPSAINVLIHTRSFAPACGLLPW